MSREGEAEALAEGVSSGVLDIVSSHHAAYNSQQRALGKDSFVNIPKGVTGVEERMVSKLKRRIVSFFYVLLNIFGCESSPISRNVPSSVRPLVDKCKVRPIKAQYSPLRPSMAQYGPV